MKMIKKLLLIAVAVLSGFSLAAREYTPATVPNVQLQDARRFVSNPDGILSQVSVNQIDAMCAELKERDLAQVAVLVLDAVDEGDLDMFAHEVLNRWGVGTKGKDNGLVISVVKQQRDIQFETGYGLEGVLPDALCKRIQTVYMVPALGAGEWDKGVVDGVTAVYNVLMDNQEELSALKAAEEAENRAGRLLVLGILALFLLSVGLVSWHQIKVTTCPVCGKKGGLRLVKQEIISRTRNKTTVESTYKCRKCGHIVKRTNTHHTGDGGIIAGGLGGGALGGFGGGSGGFGGGFGGGMSGGGGARSGF
jgi:uncharacterized protein